MSSPEPFPDESATVDAPSTHDNDTWPGWCTNVVIATPHYPGRGGTETVVANLIPMFQSVGAEVQVISVYPSVGSAQPVTTTTTLFDRRADLQTRSITGRRISLGTLSRIPMLVAKRWDIVRSRRKLARIFSSLGAETLVIATSARVAALLPTARSTDQRNRPIVVSQYHIPFEAQVEVEGVGLPVSRSIDVDAFVALSNEDAQLFTAVLGTRCARLPNPAEAPRIPSETSDGRASSSTVVSLSRLSGEKQIDRMIRSFVRATDINGLRHWRLHIYGDGDERSHLEEVIAQTSGGGDRVRLMGWADQRDEVFDGASLLLSTSRFESFGMNVLEAAQYATPTLAFACSPGIIDLVTDLDGVLVAADDDAAFAVELRRLLSSPDHLGQLGERARQHSEKYSTSSIVGEWGALIRRIREGREQFRPWWQASSHAQGIEP
ncbi:glycosyltransferase [Microbacterium sp. MMO-10]|uniref:glycosyltransferase n=1 Tax=Microbacterium sp. MMO-10 TaxID=3081272 RepID=UPI0030169B11